MVNIGIYFVLSCHVIYGASPDWLCGLCELCYKVLSGECEFCNKTDFSAFIINGIM